MKKYLHRREFLKLAGAASLSYALPRFLIAPGTQQSSPGKKNILVIVFDALSSNNIPFYGYPRQTMPNLANLADRAVVYHNHFAAGNFTTPGTASLLTGTLPWTHRAFNYNGTVDQPFLTWNIFHAFRDHYRLAYSHNPLVNTLFDQFVADLEDYIPRETLFLANDSIIQTLFSRDEDIASLGWNRTIKREEQGYAYSLYLSRLYEEYRDRKITNLKPLFPRGLPNISGDNYFLLEQAIDSIGSQLSAIPQPFFAYLHFLPPHFPYKTYRDFYGRFSSDGFKPVQKPVDLFTQEKSPDNLLKWRTWYDEYILYADREFGRLFDALERSGQLENTWILFTSDHGEMFERGISGHTTPVLYQPLMRIPLLIFEPGRQSGEQVYTPTSAIDVLPTLLYLSGQEIPDWVEGAVLPPYIQTATSLQRSLYALQARNNGKYDPLSQASSMLIQGRYKLVYYFGYDQLGEKGERIELYDLESDPEELNDLYASQTGSGTQLLDELKSKLAEVNRPYI